VLSGYLIGGQLMQQMARNQEISFRDFYLRRSLRIFPAYLVVLLLYFTLPSFREKETISPLWKFLTFTMNFGLDKTKYAAFSHAWSLCIEEQFYLVLPLILIGAAALKAGRKAMYLVPVLFIAGFAVRYFSWMHFVAPFYTAGTKEGLGPVWLEWVYYPTWNRLDGLLAGVTIAAIFSFRPVLRDKLTRYGNSWLFFGLGLLTCAYFLCADLNSFGASVFGFPLVSLGYGCVVLAALSPGCVLARFSWKGSVLLATLAYSVYLTHKQIINLTQDVLSGYGVDKHSNLMLCCCMLAAVAAGAALYLLVERPFLKLRDRILRRSVTVS
jgi:peptidoglycan/LPS O-acetylase OafA/YrhL